MPDMRFTDEKLQQFYTEFVLHAEETKTRHEELRTAIDENAKVTNELAKSTAGLLDAWQVSQSALRALVAVGNAIKWIASVGVIIGGAIAFIKSGWWK